MKKLKNTWSPWGKVDYSKQYCRGITFVATASHGGLRVSKGLAMQMPISVREIAIKSGNYFWFEEDCAFYLVVLAFPNVFPHIKLEDARRCVRNWYPWAYQDLTGVILKIEDSYTLLKRDFEEKTKNDFVGFSAVQVDESTVKVNAKRYSDQKIIEIFVSQSDYSNRGRFGFVVPKNVVETVLE